jgi:hypothetical protein
VRLGYLLKLRKKRALVKALFSHKERMMIIDNLIIEEINQLPNHLKLDVWQYIKSLKKHNEAEIKEVTAKTSKRVFGSANNKYQLADNFDDPLDDFADYYLGLI